MKVAKLLVMLHATALDRFFDYLIPPHLEQKVMIGARVVAPFQNKPVVAFVWEITESTEFGELKEIQELLDDPPLIGNIQYQLVNWLAPYYFCSRIEVLKLCLPPGVKRKRQDYYQLTVDEQTLKQKLKERFPDKEEAFLVKPVLKAAKAQESCKEWEKAMLSIPGALDFLCRSGLIVKFTGISAPQVREKTYTAYCWTGNTHEKETNAGEAVKEVLLAHPDGLSRPELCKAAHVSSGVITRLVKENKLTSDERRIYRQPLGLNTLNDASPVAFNPEQQAVYEEIHASSAVKPGLLYGVTGSGKTEIYFELAANVLKEGKQVLYLVPEISLTPQTLARAQARFGTEVALLHSRMSDGERYDQWFRVKNGEAHFVLGARSALFAPFTNLGLIIVDEEHETTYKQEEAPRYHVRRVGEKLAELTGARLIFGSATPSIESFYRACEGEFHLFQLKKRYNRRPLPEVTLVDMREELQKHNKHVLSGLLFQAIETTLERKEQVILLLNRRGYSTFVLCRDCGRALQCPSCEVSLTYHSDGPILRCHYCDYRQKVPDTCPSCHSNRIRYFGHGTQKLEAELNEAFPQAKIIRMDQDTTSRKDAHYQIYQELASGKVDILLGTQMVAKGLDLPGVTLVGVVSADSTLNMPDFRAAERCFHLLTQVAGRAGRGNRTGHVIFQTYNPEHYALSFAKTHDFPGFYQKEIVQRRQMGFPPFTEMVKVSFSSLDESKVTAAAGEFHRLLMHCSDGSGVCPSGAVEILGPAPAVIPKIDNAYRWQLLVKGEQPRAVEELLQEVWKNYPYRKFSDVRVNRDRNPYSVI